MKTQTLGVVVGKVVVERETMVVVLETDNETRSLRLFDAKQFFFENDRELAVGKPYFCWSFQRLMCKLYENQIVPKLQCIRL